ncbi:MAG: glycoside hydrolase family 5 protein [Ignavibacteria bacterium]
MKKLLAIIILITLIKNSSIGQQNAFIKDSSSIIRENVFSFFKNITLNKFNEDFKINLWKIDSYLRGANAHPYKHFSPFSMRDPITEKDLFELKKLGANLVVANYPGIFTYFPPYQIDSLSLMNLDKIVQLSERLKLFLVISIRSGPGRSLFTFFDKYREDEILFHDSTAQEKYIEMCKFIVDRYKDKKYLIGINFLLEPHGDDPVYLDRINDSVYFNFIERLIYEVRKVDSKIPIIVQPQGWAYPDKFASMKKFNDEKIVYSFDMYFPHAFTNELNDSSYPGYYFDKDSLVYVDSSYLKNFLSIVNNFKLKYSVPIFVNEYGGIRFKKGMINYIKDLHQIFLESGFHFAFYVWKSEWGEIDGNSFDEYNYEKGTERLRDLNSLDKRNDNKLLKELQFIWRISK